MASGGAGALNIILKAILNPGDEVLVLAPLYLEYPYYIDNHGGVCLTVETNEDFTLNVDAIAARLSPPHQGNHCKLTQQPDRHYLQ